MSERFERMKSLEDLTTFHLAAKAEAYAEAATEEELRLLLAAARDEGLAVHLLGGGSNTVAMPLVKGLVLRIALKGITEDTAPGGDVVVTAAAGEVWDDVVRRMVGKGVGGLENLSGVPGTVGGAVVQNIGAYGVELAERIASVRVLDRRTGEVRELTNAECDFGYRSSVFKKPEGAALVVLSATLVLPSDWTPELSYKGIEAALDGGMPTPERISEAVRALRALKLPDPAVLGNAGSFFKNPVVSKVVSNHILAKHPSLVAYPLGGARTKLAAGWLIEQAGMKGARRGAAGIYEKHALILVNHGGATGEDVKALMEEIQHAVRERFNVALEPEPVFLA